MKIFHDRTGVNFIHALNGNFTKVPGKYNWIDRVQQPPQKKQQPNQDPSTSSQQNLLPPEIRSHPVVAHNPSRDLIARLFDEKTLTDSMLTMKIDPEKMPLVTLQTDTIEAGKKILNELLPLIEAEEQKKKQYHHQQQHDSSSSSSSSSHHYVPSQEFTTKTESLSNRFVNFIPRTVARGKEHELIINSTDKVSELYQLLSDLSDILLTRQLSSLFSSGAGDPLYNKFSSLELSKFEPLDLSLADNNNNTKTTKKKKTTSKKSSSSKSQQTTMSYEEEEVRNILQFAQNGQGATHDKFKILNVWRIQRDKEDARFKPFEQDPNRQLLWHGSRFSNFTRILKDGLLIAPPGVPIAGAMFDSGSYFANAFSKAANYTRIYGNNEKGLMLLAEVALGPNPYLRYQSDYKARENTQKNNAISCYARGKNTCDPKGDIVDSKHGYTIPAGKFIKHKNSKQVMSLIYDERIVYDVAQIKLRYLVEVQKV